MDIETFIKLFANKKVKHRKYTNEWWVLDKVEGDRLWGTNLHNNYRTFWELEFIESSELSDWVSAPIFEKELEDL